MQQRRQRGPGRLRRVVLLSLAFALGIGLAPSGSSPAEAASQDTGEVSVLGRRFFCSTGGLPPCSGSVGTVQPGIYASNRDCGFSTKLHTDRAGRETHLWVFCDTPLYQLDGRLQYNPLMYGYMKTNTAGLTRYDPASPVPARDQKTRTAFTVRTDGTHDGTRWTEFIPAPSIPGCSNGKYPAAWPGSAVTLPNETGATVADTGRPATATVLIFFQDVCVSADGSVTMHGSGVASWTWSAVAADDPHQQFAPTNAAHHQGLRATVLERDLFASPINDVSFHHAATVDDLGALGRWLRVLNCHQKNLWHPELQPKAGCEIAQVRIDGRWSVDRANVADISKWSYLRNPYLSQGAWQPFQVDPATGEGLPADDGFDITNSRDADPATGVYYGDDAPNGHTDIIRHQDRWVMISMKWGYDADVVVRTSRSLTGPWSAGRILQLPAPYCGQDGGSGCYAPVWHPQLSNATTLGLSYVDNDGLRGTCRTAVPTGETCELRPTGVQKMRTATIPVADLPAAP